MSSREDWSISTAPCNRYLEILWHCLTRNTPYDEVIHVANRNRALGRSNQLKPAA
ncbi:hypothetical protein GCM10023322_50790 [Rugosimonospora acidiphila]|uniref:Uncharacterized protein n=1 Tax=Rugosimonospora acidiphila TaxID=556531 RepID=A0ABP9S9G4_9ACTN